MNLDGPTPRPQGTWDQLAFWANLGVSLLGSVTALYLLYPNAGPKLSLVAAFVALCVGTVLGTLLVSIVSVPGVEPELSLVDRVYLRAFGRGTDRRLFRTWRPRTWNVREDAPVRWIAVVPWIVGIAIYQLVAPSAITRWASGWHSFADTIGWHSPSWSSASVASFVVSLVLTLLLAPWMRRSAGRTT